MSTTTMHFGPEWMRPKQQSIPRPQQPPSPPPINPPPSAMSTYSALVSSAPPIQAEHHDEAHPFRYSKEDLLRIYKDGGGRPGLGLEVERWEGVVREYGSDPVGLREMGEAEKKLFAGPLNSDLRRRQSNDYLSPLSTANLGSSGSRLNHNSSAVGSPMRERFGKRRDSNADSPNPAIPRKQSLSSLQAPAMSPREVGVPSPRTRVGYTPSFDGVLNGGDSWVARRRASEASQKPGGGHGGENDFSEKTERIKEEKEEENDSAGPLRNSSSGALDNGAPSSNEFGGFHIAKGVGDLAGGIGQLSLNTNISSPVDNIQNHSAIGAPPGLIDLASVEWSYKDPTGTIQGPFRADLMQKWCDDGYFTPDLPMKRTHLDTTWSTLEQLRRRCDSDRVFVTPLHPTPPGLVMRNHSPLQYNAVDQTTNGPYQPAPIRSLRTSTLESYISTGSNHSESPSSSFGGGRFGDSSPEPNAFGGRAISNQFYGSDPSGNARGSGFQTTPDIPPTFSSRRGPHTESPIDGPLGMRSGGYGGYGFTQPFGSAQSPWGASSNNFAIGYEVIGSARDAHDHIGLQNYENQGLGINYSGLGSPQDTVVDSSHPAPISYTAGPDHTSHTLLGDQYGGFNLATSAGHEQHYTQIAPQFNSLPQQQLSSIDPMYAQSSLPTTQTNVPTQHSPWPDPAETNISRTKVFDSQPTVNNVVAQPVAPPARTSAWDQSVQLTTSVPIPKDASPWVIASHGAVDNAWKESVEDTPAVDETQVVGEGDAQRSPIESAPVATTSGLPTEVNSEPGSSETSPAPALLTAASSSGKPRKNKEPKPTSVPAPAPPSQIEPTSLQQTAPKPAWQKEDEAKKTISLRDIQEAEAKRTEARKAAERERERAARAAASPEKEDIQPFTASWGLPTSQAGSRGASLPVKEISSSPVAAATTPVWTNAPKIAPAKKTMKEILEEEEKRKKMAAPQSTVATAVATSTPRRPYAESNPKSPVPVFSGAWTTVGPNGKSNPAAATPSLARPTPPLNTSAAPRTDGPAPTRPAQPSIKPATLPATRIEDVAPSHEFLNWLNDSLKGLNNSVSVEEIMNMLLTFPIEADASIREIISETIYTNSTTMDGRRFADEFVSRRKADVVAHAKNGGASKGPARPVSIADVVKAAPKSAQPEWGFKVVNKKKKGGRS